MKKRNFIFKTLILSLLLTNLAWGQNTKKAKELFDEGSSLLRVRKFEEGIKKIERAIEVDPNLTEGYATLAQTYKILRYSPEKVEGYFRKVTELAPNDPKFALAFFETAQGEFSKGNYLKAKPLYAKFVSFGTGSPAQKRVAERNLASCDYGMEGIKKPVPFSPKPLPKTINTFPLQYFPALTADQQTMIYTVRKGIELTRDEDMYVSRKKDGEWQLGEPLRTINTSFNEGTCSISGDGKVMIFTACEGSGERIIIGRCDLFISYKEGNNWTTPTNMGEKVNSPYWDSQPTLSADGRTIYFASDRPGGVGGIDIYRSKLDEKGRWTVAENVGSTINTPTTDLAPFIHTNGKTMFFVSEGHLGYGGFDIFKTELVSNNEWSKPQNVGYPLNDHRNQFGFYITSDGKKGYYSHETAENGQMVASVIHEFEVPAELKIQTISNVIKGKVFDAKTLKMLQAKIELYNLATNQVEAIVSSDKVNGEYLIVLNQGEEYALYVNKEKYLFQSLSFANGKDGKDIELDIKLEPIEKDVAITLNNLFFESGKWDLQDKSKTELDKLLKFLAENATIKIEISGHTDDVGADAFNKDLSQKRAQAVVDYLLKANVEKSRLIAVGYGETKPLQPNTNEANRAKNRRIEFKIK